MKDWLETGYEGADHDALTREAGEKWRQIAHIRQREQDEMQKKLQDMPDVRMRPEPEQTWGHPGIKHRCGGVKFKALRWVTVNGIKEKAELLCLKCKQTETWDWLSKTWIG